MSTTTGSIMLELCIALALFALTIQGLSTGIYYFSTAADTIEPYRQTLYESQKIFEEALAVASYSLNAFSSSTSNSTTTDQFTKRIIVKNISPCKKEFTAQVILSNSIQLQSSSLTTSITSPEYSLAVGSDCDGKSITSSSTKQYGTLHTADMLSGTLDALNEITYALINTSSSSKLSIVNSKDIVQEISSLTFPDKSNAIDSIYNFSFIGFATSTQQIRVIDTINQQTPKILASRSLPGVGGSFPGALSLTYYNNYLYIGTHRTAGNEFHIFDVTDRSNPRWLGSREINHNINNIIVRGSYAYLATSGNVKDVIILDISKPNSIQEISTIEISGNEDARVLYLLGTTLYVGRSRSKNPAEPELSLVDIQNPLAPKISGSLYISESISSLFVSEPFSFIFVKGPPSKIITVDISSSTPFISNSEILRQPLFDIDYEKNIMYGI